MEIIKGIHQISLPTPFPMGTVNVFFLEGRLPTLVDTGLKVPGSQEALEAGLAEAGYSLADIAQVFVTHAHIDHYGLVGFAASRGARVYSYPESIPWLVHHAEENARRAPATAAWLQSMGVSQNTLAQMEQMGPQIQEFMAALAETVSAAEPVYPGQEFLAGDDVWQVHFFPGHSLTHLALYRERDGVMIGGDVLLKRISSNPVVEVEPGKERVKSLPLYADSLSRLAQIPVSTVLTGHGDPVTEHVDLISNRLAEQRERQEVVLSFLAEGPLTASGVSKRLFPKSKADQMLLTISESLGHLDVLEEQNRLFIEDRNGVFYFGIR